MKCFVLLVAIGVALGAPLDELQRIRKSHEALNGPCEGAAPIALYLANSVPDTHNREARSYYEAPGAALGGAGAALSGAAGGLNLAAAASGGPAVGLFPNAKLGGCAVPLLLSCAPSVHSGHIAHSAPAYRADDHKRESTFESQWEDDQNMRASTFDNQWEGSHKMEPTGKSQWEANHEMRSTQQNQFENNHQAMKPHHHHHVLAIDLHHNTQ